MDFKKLLENKMVVYLGGLMVLFIVIIVLVGACSMIGGGHLSFSALESRLLDAGKKYYSENNSLLPSIGNEVSVDASTLTANNHMDDINDLAPSGATCSGQVVVKNTNGNYYYTAYLNCGNDYSTVRMSDYIKNNSTVVSGGDGLYQYNDSLVYRGENPNNYIEFAGRIYRIVSVNSNGSLTIIADTRGEASDVWDDRYNIDRDSNDGINTYSLSRVRERLNSFINSTSFSDDDRMKLEYTSVCVGKVSQSSVYSRNMECGEVLENQIISLLPLSNYMYASLDSGCRLPEDGACQNYNYLSQYQYNWWTSTADINSSYKVYSVNGGSSVYLRRASSTSYTREVLTLASNAVYSSGDGTVTNPYKIK